MTNGLWFDSPEQTRRGADHLHDAGFTGKLGLSVDKFHGIPTGKLAGFCRPPAGFSTAIY